MCSVRAKAVLCDTLGKQRAELLAGPPSVRARHPGSKNGRVVADALEGKAARAAPDLRGALQALERAAQSSREVTICRYVLRDVERMGIRALTSYAPVSGTLN